MRHVYIQKEKEEKIRVNIAASDYYRDWQTDRSNVTLSLDMKIKGICSRAFVSPAIDVGAPEHVAYKSKTKERKKGKKNKYKPTNTRIH